MRTPEPTDVDEALRRFGMKQADLSTIIPAVAGPAIGGYLGRRYLGNNGTGSELGALIGGVTGGIAGQYVREEIPRWRAPTPQQDAPYAMDPTIQDIPPWALANAQFLQRAIKAGSDLADVIGGDLGGSPWTVVDGMRKGLPGKQIGKNVLGQGVGVLGGGLAGHGAGMLLDHLAGGKIKVPGLNMELSTILSGLGATIGGVKGLHYARG